MRRTKIVCTIGPASNRPEMLDRLVAAGMDVARLNFSHGTHAEHAEVIRAIREGEARWGRPITILQDLQGPKVRLGTFVGGQAMLTPGEHFVLTTRTVKGTASRSSLNHPEFLAALRPGDAVWMDDGMIQLVVEKVEDGEVECRIISGGPVSDHKGVSFPRLPVPVSCLAEKDREDLLFGIEQAVDYVAISFVRSAADIQEVRKFLHDQGANIPIVAKLERAEIVANLQGLLPLVDAVMVARGDLGVEVPLEEVPVIQKDVIRQARLAKVPVIVATQMLESMVTHSRPTRAEVSDVATAIFDGADAIMLSAETATGRFPVETVEMMARIAERAERAVPPRTAPASGRRPMASRRRSRRRPARRPGCSTPRPSWPSPSRASARGSSPRTGRKCRSWRSPRTRRCSGAWGSSGVSPRGSCTRWRPPTRWSRKSRPRCWATAPCGTTT